MNLKSYDKIVEYDSLLLDLPYREGTGVKTFDHAKPHHPLTMEDPGGGSFVWTTLPSGLMVLEFVTIGGGGTDGVYIKGLAADTVDFNFTAGDFSIGCWVNWDSTGGWSEMMMARYIIDQCGWELYFDVSGGLNTLSQRHNHLSLTPNLNSNCYSTGWTPGTWAFVGVSRVGGNLYPQHYRNGNALAMFYEASGMLDPDTCVQTFQIGCRYTLNANWYKGLMWRPRIWNRALSQNEWKNIFERERDWFGV